MNTAVSLAAGVVVGAAATLALAWGRRADEAEPPDPRGLPGTAPPTATEADPVAPRLERMAGELARLSAAVESLGRKIEREPAPRAERAPVAAPAAGRAVIDEDALVRALQRVETEKLAALSTDELMARARRDVKLGDPAAARRALGAALERALAPEERARVQTRLGMLHRSSGDYEASARVLRGVVGEFGVDSPEGAQAALQLVWTQAKNDDGQNALQLADTVAGSPRVDEQLRVNARLAAAIVADSLGDRARARADLQRILAEVGDRSQFRKLAAEARRRLDEMR